jgi:hypothetical protein
MERRQRVGIFFGLAIVVVLSLALTAWHGIAQTARPAPAAGDVGRYQIVVAPNLVSEYHTAETLRTDKSKTVQTEAFLLDTQTGRVWQWTDSLVYMGLDKGAGGTIGWLEKGVEDLPDSRKLVHVGKDSEAK